MSISTLSDLQAELAALRDHFVATLPDRLDRITGFWSWIVEFGWEPDSAAKARIAAHSLAGSAATFGFTSLADHARRLEAALEDLVAKNRLPRHAELDRVEAALALTREVAGHAHPDLDITQQPMVLQLPDTEPTAGPHDLYLLEDDDTFATLLATQLTGHGYRITHLSSVSQLAAALADHYPAALLVDLALADGPLAGAEALAELRRERPDLPPAIILSVRDDLAARLAAVRATAQGYFTKPVDPGALTEMLVRLTAPPRREPYRVLLVDDDAVTGLFHASILQAAGMETLAIDKPLNIMQALVDFAPDLLLLDLYMPECSGVELAAVIRQHPAFFALPIVYASGEESADRQLAAIAAGGDDFLIKPVRPDRLISSVASRAERMRIMRALTHEDSMTGLLNHTAIKERASVELARCRRTERPLAVAMIDIDDFRKVNDRFAHAAGDAVIKAVARVLTRGLRRADAVGRYGGDSFVIVMPETGVKSAALRLDALRKQLAGLAFRAGGKDFQITVSCGVAGYPERLSEVDLIDAAADALRETKHDGRGRVGVAGRV